MVEDWSPLVEIAPQQQLALEIVKYTLLTTNRQSSETAKVRKKLNSTVPALVVVFRDASDVNSLLDFMNEVLTSLSIEVRLQSILYTSPKIVHQNYRFFLFLPRGFVL